MYLRKVEPELIPELAREAAAVLKQGGIVLYPTDTLYGLGADALSDEAVGALRALKGRDEQKPIHAIVPDIAMVEQYGEVNDTARKILANTPQGLVTLIVKKRPDHQTGIFRGIETFGFRIPDNELCIAMARAFGGPITATSANKSGETPASSLGGILAQLGPGVSLTDLALDGGTLPERAPSTVVDVSSGEAIVLREGAVSAHSIRLCTGK